VWSGCLELGLVSEIAIFQQLFAIWGGGVKEASAGLGALCRWTHFFAGFGGLALIKVGA
jgi:hypothetical protein